MDGKYLRYAISGMVGSFIGIVGGVEIGRYQMTPKEIYEVRVDGRDFTIVESRDTQRTPFVRRTDNSVKRLDDVNNELLEKVRHSTKGNN